jgi:hypothetical protein
MKQTASPEKACSNMEIRQGPGGAIYEKIGCLVCGKLLVMLAQVRGFFGLTYPLGLQF